MRDSILFNQDKSVFTPTQELQISGFILHSVHVNLKPNDENEKSKLLVCDYICSIIDPAIKIKEKFVKEKPIDSDIGYHFLTLSTRQKRVQM